MNSLDKAITRFRKRQRRSSAPAPPPSPATRGPASRNATMLKAARKVVKGMTALDAWDYTAYPHEQTMWDNEYMVAALARARRGPGRT